MFELTFPWQLPSFTLQKLFRPEICELTGPRDGSGRNGPDDECVRHVGDSLLLLSRRHCSLLACKPSLSMQSGWKNTSAFVVAESKPVRSLLSWRCNPQQHTSRPTRNCHQSRLLKKFRQAYAPLAQLSPGKRDRRMNQTAVEDPSPLFAKQVYAPSFG